jgi:hypothetical protein
MLAGTLPPADLNNCHAVYFREKSTYESLDGTCLHVLKALFQKVGFDIYETFCSRGTFDQHVAVQA